MIAASTIALAFALYFTSVVVLQGAYSIANKTHTDLTASAITAAIAWAAFYYFTHAA